MKVYTDGSCLGNPGRGGWAFIAISHDGDELFRNGGFGGAKTTNNIMELTAMLKALRWVYFAKINQKYQDDIIIYTDSNYCKTRYQFMDEEVEKEWLQNS